MDAYFYDTAFKSSEVYIVDKNGDPILNTNSSLTNAVKIKEEFIGMPMKEGILEPHTPANKEEPSETRLR